MASAPRTCVGAQPDCGDPVVARRARVAQGLVLCQAGLAVQRELHSPAPHQPACAQSSSLQRTTSLRLQTHAAAGLDLVLHG